MLYRGLRLENADGHSDLRVEDGLIVELAPQLSPALGEEVMDFGGELLLPPFVEPHLHLDTTMTAGEPRYNSSGTLFEGIALWSERKTKLDKADCKARARRALQRLIKYGVQAVRTHVDSTDPRLIALEALLELKEEVRDWIDLQIVAFPQEGICSFPNGKALLESALRLGVDAVGAIPHFEFTREYAVDSLNYAMALAEKYQVLVDVHCDEIDYEGAQGLETLACRALESGLKERVTASHTTAMHSYNDAYVQRLFRLLKLSDINFIANPLVNIHLQGRIDRYPKRRGITRVSELLANGNCVAFGHDDIRDPWYPMGEGNPLQVVSMGVHVCQRMGYEELMQSYRFVTHNAARCLQLKDYGIAVGHPANFIVLNAPNWYEALSQQSEVLLSVHRGKIISRCTPKRYESAF